MTKLFVICGHGAGDPGARKHGYEEAERVRVLGKRIKELGGSNVMLGDINRNYYEDNGISKLNISKDYQIIELHMDSATATARGAHVIIQFGIGGADKYDIALANFITGVLPGRSKKIDERNDLANPARAYEKGYGYRLLECGFISNKEDLNYVNTHIDEIAKGILKAFGIGASESKPSKPSKPSTGTKYKVGDTVNINGVYTSSSSTNKLKPARTSGKITKIIAGAKNPYLLDNGNLGWVNDACITGKKGSASKPKTLKVGMKAKPKKAVSYEGVKLDAFVTKNYYKVIEIKGKRVVLDKIMTAFNIDNLTY